ncbi:MAG: Rap1a/Tai family immunity protein [Burkholderiales bacterium]
MSKCVRAAGLLVALLLAQVPLSHAEVDGEEFLGLMQSGEEGRKAAQFFIDDVWQRWDQKVFCMPPGDRQQMSFDAVEVYLETHPQELYRPRRYLIVQALRDAFACGSG